MNNVKTYKDQSVFDIAIQEYGSIEGVFDLLKNNPGLEFDSDIESGTALNTSGTIIDQSVVDYYKKNNIKPATGDIEGLPEYKEDEKMITKTYNYDLAGGDITFEGIRLYNLNKDLTVQINYSDIVATNVKVYIESSLDGVNYAAIPYCDYTLHYDEDSHTFYIYDIITSYIRLRVEVGDAVVGTIDGILIKL